MDGHLPEPGVWGRPSAGARCVWTVTGENDQVIRFRITFSGIWVNLSMFRVLREIFSTLLRYDEPFEHMRVDAVDSTEKMMIV